MPSRFTGALQLTSLDADCRIWRLDEPLVYELGVLGSGLSITVPAGFLTDGASVPRLLQGLLPAWGRWSRAAILHDYLCREIDRGGFTLQLQARPLPLSISTRAAADFVFWEAMRVLGVNRAVAFLFWFAVRAADRLPWLREASADFPPSSPVKETSMEPSVLARPADDHLEAIRMEAALMALAIDAEVPDKGLGITGEALVALGAEMIRDADARATAKTTVQDDDGA